MYLEKLLEPYMRAIQGTPSTSASLSKDPVYASLLAPPPRARTPNPVPASPGATNHEEGLEPLLQRLVGRLPWLDLTSGYRSEAEQAALYAQKPDLAAPPGHSFHEVGGAIDVHADDIDHLVRWLSNHPKFGSQLYRPMDYEPWHFQLYGDREDYL
jgi:hypothetical protein